MKKHLLQICLICAALCALLCVTASAAKIVESGTCGENLTWTLDDNGTLTISGTGEMYDWYHAFFTNFVTPWDSKRTNIKTVMIHDGVTSIGLQAFFGCSELTNITIPDSVNRIRNSAFSGCTNLTDITIPNGVTYIANDLFSSCRNLRSIEIPESVTLINGNAFLGCTNLVSITIPENVNQIGSYAFSNCSSLTAITIPDSVTLLGSTLSGGCFNGCNSLTNIILPENLTRINGYMFSGCTALTSITIPESVTNIGIWAFKGCEHLTDIYYAGTAAQWSEIYINGLGNDELKNAAVHYGADDIGINITLSNEDGEKVDPSENAFTEGANLTAKVDVADSDAVANYEFVTANVFVIFYDAEGRMVYLHQSEINLSDPLNVLAELNFSVPAGAKTLKILILSDEFVPLRAARMIESSATDE